LEFHLHDVGLETTGSKDELIMRLLNSISEDVAGVKATQHGNQVAMRFCQHLVLYITRALNSKPAMR
jgi:hypothetical protein